MTDVARGLVGLLIGGLLAVGCAVGDSTRPADDDVLEVFTNYRNADAEAFRETLDAFTEATGIAVRHVGTAGFAARIRDRVRQGDPPDIALFPQPSLVRELADDGLLVALDDVVVGDTLVEGTGNIGVVDGTRYGVWFRMSVKSLVWYSPPGFRAGGYTVPDTWGGLLALTSEMVEDGVAPWCLGMEAFDATGWVGTDWVEDLVLREAGVATYDAWALGDIAFTDGRIATAFDEFGSVARAEDRVLGGTRAILTTPALEAILPMLDDPPSCLLSRQASFQRSELPDGTAVGPDGDVDVFAFPSSDGGPAPLVAGGEIATTFADDAEALALIGFLADPAAGRVWARRGGFTSPHASFAISEYRDPFDRRMAELIRDTDIVRFDASDQMPPAVGTGTFWRGIVGYVAGRPLPAVLDDIQAGYDTTDDPALLGR